MKYRLSIDEMLKNTLSEKYWLANSEEFPDRIREITGRDGNSGRLEKVGESFSKRPIYAVFFGHGGKKLFVLTAVHGWEVVGTYSQLALIDSLFSGVGLNEEDLSGWKEEVKNAITVCFIPLASPDVAERHCRVIKDGYFPSRFSETENDWINYARYINDPYEYFTGNLIAGSFKGFTEKQVEEWSLKERELGVRWSDQGMDIAVDYKDFVTPECQVIRKVIEDIKPGCILEYHGHEGPTFLYPTILTAEKDKQINFINGIIKEVQANNLPVADKPIPLYVNTSITSLYNYVERNTSALFIGAELRMYKNKRIDDSFEKEGVFPDAHSQPMLSQDEIIKSGWVITKKLIDLMLADVRV